MKKYLKISLVVFLFFSFVLAPNFVKAQTEGSSTSECIDLQNNLKFGDRDVNKKGEVTILQNYLKSQGYLTIAPSGYFGTSTLKAVLNFQKANNIKPALGFVGSLTKSKIKDLSCIEDSNTNCFNGIQDFGETGIDTGGSCDNNKICPEGMTGTYPNCTIVIAICDYPAPAPNCSYVKGPDYNPKSQCGLILKCEETPCPTGTIGTYPNCIAIPKPTLSLTANPISIESGSSTSLSWTSTNATTCTASGDWFGNKPLSGSESISNLTTTKSFTLTCNGEGGSISKSVSVGVYVVDPVLCPSGTTGTYPDCVTITPKPTVKLTAFPTSVPFGGQTTLTWYSTNAKYCTASNAWYGSKNTSGTLSFGIYTTSPNTFTLTCTGVGGTTTASATVGVSSVNTDTTYNNGCTQYTLYSTTTGAYCNNNFTTTTTTTNTTTTDTNNSTTTNTTANNTTVTNTNASTSTSLDLTPRVSIWGTKLSQYLNDKGFWVTDLNSGYVHTNEILGFCKKWYPTTTSLEYYKEEYIPNWVNLSTGANETFYSNHFSYKCVGGTHSGPSKVLGAEIDLENSCSLSKTLMKGMNDEEVKCLQKKLNEKGYQVKGTENSKEIKFFGYNTELALKKFQKANNLKIDGILGFNTIKLLNQ